ncbi:FAD-dependent oxidoreductase [Sphingobacterium thalpophilum]|uniref:FAD-dependent oxidoreductase n=1 Tax=Sphingobacterium thalpophilum TaxID=259 RepID=UPI0031DEB629
MIVKEAESAEKRSKKRVNIVPDLVVVGGGLSGVCAALAAARQGLKVTLVQDRPVLGGNASSEVRLWILGATSHMGNNNRWSREGGIIDEILVENTYRNPEGNPLILDMILLEKVYKEANITLLLNTVVYDLEKNGVDEIAAVVAFCSQNSTEYYLKAPLFCDASGDGILGFMAGAAFRMGAESTMEFGELMAPDQEYGELLGHSLYFYSKDVGKPVKFIPPAFALDVTKEIPRFRNFNAREFGCKLWWVEHGGRMDTVYDSEQIKFDLWKIVYGVWDYIKNSGNFPEADTMTLEWVGTIPGKRESRRFEGDYIMTQHDLVEQRQHVDAIAYGGWSIDLHPADGIFGEKNGCDQWHSKGIFQIPYRSIYSRNIKNLFLSGRIISVSHVAFGATRVMATSAYVGEAVGMAAALCKRFSLRPRELGAGKHMRCLQNELLKIGHYIPSVPLRDETDLVQAANLRISSAWAFRGFAAISLKWKPLDIASGQLLPVPAGKWPVVKMPVRASENTLLTVELRTSAKAGNFTPDVLLDSKQWKLQKGEQELELSFDIRLPEPAYVFLIFRSNAAVQLPYTEQRVTGIVAVRNGENKAVSNFGKQLPPPGKGVDEFEFWCPERRPQGQNLYFTLSESIDIFQPDYLKNGVDRPTTVTNAWVADPEDSSPTVELKWKEKQYISSIDLFFDTDFDHPMESVLMTHPETVMPFCIREYRILDGDHQLIYEQKANYRSRDQIRFNVPIFTDSLTIQLNHPSAHVPAALFAVRCYAQ